MKENIDLLSAVAGGTGALIKGVKRRRKFRTIVLDALVGIILGWSTIGLLDYFLEGANFKLVILVSFAVGYVTNELTDVLERLVEKSYDFIVSWFQSSQKSKDKTEPEV